MATRAIKARTVSARGRYRKGKQFEDDVREDLAAVGYACVRAAGSKGGTKADVVAFHPGGWILIVQCKTGTAQITKIEWDRLVEVARWFDYPSKPVPGIVVTTSVVYPVLATKVTGSSQILYERLNLPKVAYSRDQPKSVIQVTQPWMDKEAT